MIDASPFPAVYSGNREANCRRLSEVANTPDTAAMTVAEIFSLSIRLVQAFPLFQKRTCPAARSLT
jgi:hypothetical protein